MGLYAVKPDFQRALRVAENWCVVHGIHPDVLTYAALVLSVLAGALLYTSPAVPWLLLAVPLLAFLRTALNALDGMVAKTSGLARPWGEVLNEFCDRLADVAIFSGLALAPTTNLLLGAATLVAILLSSYLGTVSRAAGGSRQYGGIMGKADRMLYLSLACVLAFFFGFWLLDWCLGAILIGVVVTVIQRWRRIFAELHTLGP